VEGDANWRGTPPRGRDHRKGVATGKALPQALEGARLARVTPSVGEVPCAYASRRTTDRPMCTLQTKVPDTRYRSSSLPVA